MSALKPIDLTLFLDNWNKQLDETIKRLMKTLNVTNYAHTSGTNVMNLTLNNRSQLPTAIAQIKKIPDVSLYYTHPDHLKEVSDAIDNVDYFKAFTLCVSLYESFGKSILIAQFKNLSLNSERLEKLGIQNVILMLYTHGLIKEGTYSDMISVTDTRNEFVHDYMSSTQSDKNGNQIKENIRKIRRSLETLKRINETEN